MSRNLGIRRPATAAKTAQFEIGADEDVPKFRALERKDVRLRADQLDGLARLTRDVSAARVSKRERITENTLVRVALDLLLEQSDRLAGDTEEELRASLSAELEKH